MHGKKTSHHKKKKKGHKGTATDKEGTFAPEKPGKRKLEIVLKCDTSGCVEAIVTSIISLNLPEVEVEIIRSGVGSINKSDIFMAETGSRLIIGFNVGLMPHIDQMATEHHVEIRLFDVIYRLLEDVEFIARSLSPGKSVEEKVGTAKVIALFKSSRKGIILGCEVLTGRLMLGKQFRVLGSMGPMYVGTIESLHIEKDTVREARKGQQVGLKIKDFNKARVGDLIESFQYKAGQSRESWKPKGKIYYPS